jgi:hypothetical protein
LKFSIIKPAALITVLAQVYKIVDVSFLQIASQESKRGNGRDTRNGDKSLWLV